MAARASRIGGVIGLIRVAFLAHQCAMFAGQRKSGVGMIKGGQGRDGRIKGPSLVFLVARGACARRGKVTMQTIALRQLALDVLMTFQALHGLIGLKRLVAGLAL